MNGIQIDPWGPGSSRVREQLLEHQLLGEIVRLMLLQGRRCEILRAEFDGSGHDVVLEEDGILRHVQLKAMRADGKRAHVNIHTALAAKTSGCVVWMLVDPDRLIATGFLWFGARPGRSLPPLGEQVARHTKSDATGMKAERPELRLVRRTGFERVASVEELIERLFGTPAQRDVLMLKRHLLAQPRVAPDAPAWLAHLQAGRFEALPDSLSEDESIYLTHLVDGYELAGLKGPEGAAEFVAAVTSAASERNLLPSHLWAAMFLEHRRLRFEGREPSPDEHDKLSRLTTLLRRALRAEAAAPGITALTL